MSEGLLDRIKKWLGWSLPPPPPVIDCSKFNELLRLVESTKDNALVTGVAGTGKSAFLGCLIGQTRKRCAVLAPTGLAALNVRGQTIHSFFKFKPGLLRPGSIEFSPLRAQLLASIEVLIIDEVSMVRADLMDAMDISLRRHRQNALPFGGCQVLLVGDLYQLPPVVDSGLKGYFDKQYGGPYFFGAPGIRDGAFKCYQLRQVFRQSDGDCVEVLGRVREGVPTDNDLIRLNSRHVSVAGKPPEGTIVLSTTNAVAFTKNKQELAKLPSSPVIREAIMSGTIAATYKRLLIDHKGNPLQLEQALDQAFPAPVRLELKVGATVIFVKNDTSNRWVNGTVGAVTAIAGDRVRIAVGQQSHEVERKSWPRIEYESRDGVPVPNVTGMFSQYPIRLGWALTIHKAQGKSLDTALVDLASGAFAPGQAYVALSRCRSIRGLYLQQELRSRDVFCDEPVRAYMKSQSCIALPDKPQQPPSGELH